MARHVRSSWCFMSLGALLISLALAGCGRTLHASVSVASSRVASLADTRANVHRRPGASLELAGATHCPRH